MYPAIVPANHQIAAMPDLADLKENERPRAPKIEGLSEAQRALGRRLSMIHAMHLRDVAQLRALVDRIDQDRAAAGQLSEALEGLDMTRNLRTFGVLCGRECNNLLFHHGAEEHHVFPALEEQADAPLAAVLAKLRQEHEVIHALLEALHAGASAIYDSPDDATYAALRDTFGQLEATLKSHFGYEETELEDVLGLTGIL
ncbi:MAG: hemerythrin domain-containing protein [Brucellaceae bacterium]|nr:hemerythrin domain-containing protein [Brucellaceae bacterium]